MLQLALPDGSYPEIVLLRRVRKSIGLRIVAGRIEVAAAPRVPLSVLQQVLQDKRDWIWRHWQRQQAQQARRDADVQTVHLQGQAWRLQHLADQPLGVHMQTGLLLVGGDPVTLRDQVAQFLQAQAAACFPLHVQRLAPFAVRAPGPLQLSSARTRWGSCHRDGRIRLNWRLIQAPPSVLDYVIAHELAHLRHMHHAAAFWQETARLHPDWQADRAWLRRHGEQLFDFG